MREAVVRGRHLPFFFSPCLAKYFSGVTQTGRILALYSVEDTFME
jgi:hypothetical protein